MEAVVTPGALAGKPPVAPELGDKVFAARRSSGWFWL
jgi:hypothetical protein